MRLPRIALKLTYRCLGRCCYCDSRKKMWAVRGGHDMPESLLAACSKLLSHPESHPFQEIHLTGGEITILPNIFELAKNLYEIGIPLSATTAGWARKHGSWSEFLEHIPLKKLYISLDYPEKKANDRIRGSGSWDRATMAIREAVRNREKLSFPEVTVITVVHRGNIYHLEKLVNLLREWKVDRWMPAYLEGVDNKPCLVPTASDIEWLLNQRSISPTLDRALGEAFKPKLVPQRIITHGEWPHDHPLPACTTLGRLAIVHPNGAIYSCYGSEYRELGKIGHIDESVTLNIKELLDNAAQNPPAVCRNCPEPIQHSQQLQW